MSKYIYTFDNTGQCLEKIGPISVEHTEIYKEHLSTQPSVSTVIISEKNIGYSTAKLFDGDVVDVPEPPPVRTYVDDRLMTYPDVRDQLDMLWHAMDKGTMPKVDAFYDAIKYVKDLYPKT
jgi:hypothetical protein